jgi:hypothetical protein
MSESVRRRPSARGALFGATAILVYLGLFRLLLHLLTAENYGYFRDELYYVVAGSTSTSATWISRPWWRWSRL